MRDTIEIAEVMEDTVLAVHHLTPPRRAATWPLAGAAALGLLLFLCAGGYAVTVAADNQAAQRAFIEAGGSPLDFHARRLSPFAGLAALGGLLSGVGFSAWALWRRAGARRASSYHTPDGATIVAFTGDAWRFTPAPGMTGEPTVLSRGERVRATWGQLSFLIAAVPAPRATDAVPLHLDRRALAYAGASAAGHAALVALFFLMPATARGFATDEHEPGERRLSVRLMPPEDPRLVPQPPGDGGEPGGAVASGAREQGAAGALGARVVTRESGRGKIKRVQDEPSLARRDEVPRAPSSGALGVIRARREQLDAMTAPADFSSGFDEEDVRGGWRGHEIAAARGWGSAPDGTGPGGGGRDRATIGVGPSRTPYSAMRLPPGTLPGRRPAPVFVIGAPEVPEGIDKNMIRRYVRGKRAEITYCYQRELTVRPTLQGTADTSFTIGADGRVLRARARGLGAPSVERCLEEVLGSIEFPRGQIVNVTSYPFTFHPAGA